MHRWFRELFIEVRDYNGPSLYQEVVAPWTGDAKEAVDACQPLIDVQDGMHREELSWNLYALSRVLDYFVWHLQPEPPDMERPETSPELAVGLTSAELEAFAVAVGLRVVTKDEFSPFYHEPVFVESDQPVARPRLTQTLWPCLMLDNMLVYRGGVRLQTNRAHLAKELAQNSVLFWSRYRRARQSMDLSIGWGSNSQWRTAFRRDFEYDDTFLYNADGRFSLNEARHKDDQYRGDMSDAEWVHLVKYRYPLVAGHNPHDLWPWDYTYTENKTADDGCNDTVSEI